MQHATDEPKTERIHVLASQSFVGMVDNWRRRQPGGLNRSQAIRALCEIGYQAEERKTGPDAR
jgi:hypothetical protein